MSHIYRSTAYIQVCVRHDMCTIHKHFKASAMSDSSITPKSIGLWPSAGFNIVFVEHNRMEETRSDERSSRPCQRRSTASDFHGGTNLCASSWLW